MEPEIGLHLRHHAEITILPSTPRRSAHTFEAEKQSCPRRYHPRPCAPSHSMPNAEVLGIDKRVPRLLYDERYQHCKDLGHLVRESAMEA